MRLAVIFLLFCSSLSAAPSRYEFAGETGRHVYYVESPEGEESYPLALVIEGSYDEKRGLTSILRLQTKVGEALLPLGVGMASMEKVGVDGDVSDWEIFHRNNTFSNRLASHLEWIEELKKNPPKNWNGELILIGGSEGGPITIKLADRISPKCCVVLVGCGDQTFKEYIWNVIQKLIPEDKLPEYFDDLGDLRGSYERQTAFMKANPDPFQFWLGQSYLYWSDGLEQSEKQEFLNLKCPTLIVAGSEDVECESTDRLIAEAKQNGQNVTYLRIEGMDHNVMEERWGVLDSIARFIRQSI